MTAIVPVVLFASFASLASVSLTLDSVTFDEAVHLFAGASYWQTGDFRLNPEHPPLAKMWSAVPLVAAGVEPIDPTATRWRRARQRELGYEFVNGRFDESERRNPNARLVPARLAMVALGAMLVGVIHLWARDLWGMGGGIVALGLAALSPTLLAHARLVTTDVPAALGFTTTLWCFWRWCRDPSLTRVLYVGAAFGAALLLKFSTLLLPAMLGALLLLWICRPPADAPSRWTWRHRLVTGLAAVVLIAGIGTTIVWAGYGFRYRAMPSPDYTYDWAGVRVPSPALQEALTTLRHYRLLPEAYVYGLSYVLSKADRRTFLNGQILEHGSRLYFPEAFALKSTPAVLVLTAWLAWTAIRRRWSFDGLFLFIPIAIYAFVAVLSPLNIGHRHLLPIYALLFVSMGSLGSRVPWPSRPAVALAALLVLHALSSAVAFPRYLSYFNIVAGGSANGWRFLVDSNLDWGQDMRRLSAWMEANQVERIHLAYFGSADPATYGIRYRTIVQVEDFEERVPAFPGPSEYFAVSATLLQGLYVKSPDVSRWLERVRLELAPIGRVGDSIFLYQMPAAGGPQP